ncbi:hypothetical protein [Methylobacter sp.]|uniref:hypothetical protein n=1 Tax=Methylobacter sp. TaxID=2051955 RepID=UPI003DA66CCF
MAKDNFYNCQRHGWNPAFTAAPLQISSLGKGPRLEKYNPVEFLKEATALPGKGYGLLRRKCGIHRYDRAF